ncbi:HalOD1 output domain-containing protein [Haloprofundus salinisoli]|uniref:HalOD1 output domain-containing protein n=1 Tax=Haloprofundus salinisoli TaxID=2876193 RepID=UPI001CCFA380|nr:HalOD1 output domain-containing protein [Haloprofundus salinisoli]
MSISAEHRSESICEQIVTAVADRENVDPLELSPLYHALGSELRQSLFGLESERTREPSTSHTFTYHGYEVTVDGDSVQVSQHPTRQETEYPSPS